MDWIWIILGMALVTYLPRMLPAFLIGQRNVSPWMERWLASIPYAALGALIFPGILSVEKGEPLVGLAGGAVAALLAIPARGATGLGAAAAAQATPTRLVTAVTVAVAVATALLGAWVLPGVALTALAVAAVAWLAVRRLTVITGDVLGAAQQVADLLVLVAAVAVTGAGGRPVAWWF